jgi:fatty-acyl-CoA synthase
MLTGEILARSAARFAGKAAVVLGDRRWSYATLDSIANRLANALIAHGLGRSGGRQHLVGMLSPNCPEYAAFFFGAARSGCIQAHMSIRYTEANLIYVMTKSATEAVFVHADMLPLLEAARPHLPALRAVVVFGGPAPSGTIGWDEFLADAPDTPPRVDLHEEDPFAITYTGGTTGFPKAVLVSHRARSLGSINAAKVFQVRPDDIVSGVTPMFHVAGLFSWFLTNIHIGTTIVMMAHWSPSEFIDLAAREQITAVFMVPAQLAAVFNDPAFDAAKLPRWRYSNFGGSAMPVALLQRMRAAFPVMLLLEHYGQSEIGPGCYRPPERAFDKPDSVGLPFDDVNIAILGPDGKPLPVGGKGEVAVRGPTILLEYYKDPEQTAALFTEDGWMRTGDIGFLDDEGYLTLFDRAKDMIISGAENIYPTEIENALYKHPAVKECAVFAIPDERWGEVPAAHVVLADGAAATGDELIEFVAGTIARFKRPRVIKIVDALPKTAIGKVQKNVLREPYWAKAAV